MGKGWNFDYDKLNIIDGQICCEMTHCQSKV
jgi:hypothetical protein